MLHAEYVPYEKRPKGLFQGKGNTPTRFSSKVRRDRQITANTIIDSKTHMKRSRSRLSTLQKKLQKLHKAGIECDIKPIGLPEGIKVENCSDEVIAPTHISDPYDSDIEIKIPLKKSTKSVQSKVSSKKSKTSSKSKSAQETLSNKLLLAKSLDSVKALLSSKSSSKASGVKAVKSTKKVNRATSYDVFRRNAKNKPTKTKPKSRGITKKTKKLAPLNTDTVKKIAQELIRKRGDSLLNSFYIIQKKIATF
ncbi:hypothetical protein NQ314_003109 [Rhamnusium bicolor]|uniref:Uncharacterized protein n=1 Tax=Rhamnusium bicolor TaxID=1586634 RepID=A0AAV8ZN22_9CUCU|nr:hypothetical protein NQ314_003109 [Rhamnusium bicolor]